MRHTKTTRKRAKSVNIDWRRFDAMTDAQRHQAALNDPDARPMSEEDLAPMKPRALKFLPRELTTPDFVITLYYEVTKLISRP